jgi:hypothetical protein
MVDVSFSLTGSNGDTIAFDNENFVLNPEINGLLIPATNVRIEESAGDGGVWRHSKRGVRQLDLPVTVVGTDRGDVESKLRRLNKVLQDAQGATKISANYSDGSVLQLSAHYVGGAEGSRGENGGMTWQRVLLSFKAPNPFWQSAIDESFTIGSGSTGRGLLPQLTKLKISSSQSLGVVTVNNTGDVAAYPVWTIRGPISGLVISNGSQQFAFADDIAAGESFVVDTANGTVVDDSGANRYSVLDTAPKLFKLEPGISNLSVTGIAGSATASVVLTYSPRFEVIH